MAKVWQEEVVIPTYEVGLPEKNPIFLEKRVYQGSSGAVYPYPVIESISDTKIDKSYQAVYMENEYLLIMVLPELGGRIQMAYDKIARRHFIYYNHVIKPALVGLAGPWISGGIEFNWPQHHRPSTFMPVDWSIEELKDGGVRIRINEMERMTHQKGMAYFTLRPGKAYLEIEGFLSNRTDLPQTFLWWANPAVAVNDYYRSVFPPDINAVFDHGKRDVSTFPVATGTYYKMDYSAGVDIANYRNIKVPTSYMGVNSRYDFEGGYECDTQAGMLHVASHHFSPGKKQWTWGNGDFGRAWDRNLTDSDGPYIELMAGVFTENQPDFSWLAPGEEKRFKQYFLPYRELGAVKNASKDLLLNLERSGEDKLELKVFATSQIKADIVVEDANGLIFSSYGVSLSPENVYTKVISLPRDIAESVSVRISNGGKIQLEWQEESDEPRPMAQPAEAAKAPEEVKSCEQLFLTGQHLEQYRHATFLPTDYYEEALRRDPDDIRCNNAMGLWFIRKGMFAVAEKYLRRAVKLLTRRNPNPYWGEPLYNLALCLKYQQRYDEAYPLFMKSTWNAEFQNIGFYEAAKISSLQGRYEDALEEVENALIRNSRHHQALALRAALLRRLGRSSEALKQVREALEVDPFNFAAMYVGILITGNLRDLDIFRRLMRHEAHNYDEVALDFVNAGLYEEAQEIWKIAEKEKALTPMTYYYSGYAWLQSGCEKLAIDTFRRGAEFSSYLCFPNRPEAVAALETAMRINPDDGFAPYYLGCLYYDKRQYSRALELWEIAASLIPGFPTVHRNLALVYFNKLNRREMALEQMQLAFELDPTDARILMEYDQLLKRMGHSVEERLRLLDRYPELVLSRDDLRLEHATLLNLIGEFDKAADEIDSHLFHPWEGGEGKVPAQYQYSRVERAKRLLADAHPEEAESLLKECLEYPENLGEGKLHNAQENDFLYLLGVAALMKGKKDMAADYFRRATVGPDQPAAALYYNDAKPDKIFYAALAFRAVGDEDNARRLAHKLINYGTRHLFDEVRIDYFAVSLPDLLIWEDDLQLRNEIHCKYMMALGYALLGDMKHFQRYIQEVKLLAPQHQGILSTISLISQLPQSVTLKINEK